jgi:hypothetical protein
VEYPFISDVLRISCMFISSIIPFQRARFLHSRQFFGQVPSLSNISDNVSFSIKSIFIHASAFVRFFLSVIFLCRSGSFVKQVPLAVGSLVTFLSHVSL